MSISNIHFIRTDIYSPDNQADAILLESQGQFALIDGGYNNGYVLNYLQNYGVTQGELKFIVATHHHSDHIEGFPAIINALSPEKAYYHELPPSNLLEPYEYNEAGDYDTPTHYANLVNAVYYNPITYWQPPVDGQVITLGRLEIQLFNTNPYDIWGVGNHIDDYNACSMIVKVRDLDTNAIAFLMGDATWATEYKVISRTSNKLMSTGDVVGLHKIGHHGIGFVDGGTTSTEILNYFMPDIATHKKTFVTTQALWQDIFDGSVKSNVWYSALRPLTKIGSAGMNYFNHSNCVDSVICTSNSDKTFSAIYGGTDVKQYFRNAWYQSKQEEGYKWSFIHYGVKSVSKWEQIGGKWYVFDSQGIMYQNSWYLDNGYWYYLGDTGAMVTGWIQLGAYWYYLSPTSGLVSANRVYPMGATIAGTTGYHDWLVINGTTRDFDEWGHCLNP